METRTRKERQKILALSSLTLLETCWQTFLSRLAEPLPPHDFLRRPQTGMAMLRGRIGGSGSAFNLGEMTMTRTSIRFPAGIVGHGWVKGRSKRHAELIALCDAASQAEKWASQLEQEVIQPLDMALRQQHAHDAAVSAATRVDFFTMVRGESP